MGTFIDYSGEKHFSNKLPNGHFTMAQAEYWGVDMFEVAKEKLHQWIDNRAEEIKASGTQLPKSEKKGVASMACPNCTPRSRGYYPCGYCRNKGRINYVSGFGAKELVYEHHRKWLLDRFDKALKIPCKNA
jgi:hypothetical protein